jgi:hypothetical protein
MESVSAVPELARRRDAARRHLLLMPYFLIGTFTLSMALTYVALNKIVGAEPRVFLFVALATTVFVGLRLSLGVYKRFAKSVFGAAPEPLQKPAAIRLMVIALIMAVLGLAALGVCIRLLFVLREGGTSGLQVYYIPLLAIAGILIFVQRKFLAEIQKRSQTGVTVIPATSTIRWRVIGIHWLTMLAVGLLVLAIYFLTFTTYWSLGLATLVLAAAVCWFMKRTADRTIAIVMAQL